MFECSGLIWRMLACGFGFCYSMLFVVVLLLILVCWLFWAVLIRFCFVCFVGRYCVLNSVVLNVSLYITRLLMLGGYMVLLLVGFDLVFLLFCLCAVLLVLLWCL